jgi:hypothetical protein
MSSLRSWVFAGLCVLLAAPLPAAERVDAVGDPLPDGALARLGTIRLRHGPMISFLDLSADGKLLAVAGTDGNVHVYETVTGQKVWQFAGKPAQLLATAFSPDSRQLAVSHSSLIVVWDLLTGKERGKFEGHAGPVQVLAFSPDGKMLASGGSDTTALLWDLASLPDLPAAAELAENDLTRLWADLAATEAAKAGPAVLTLAAAPQQAVPFLAGKLQPVGGVEAERLEKLVADLESEKIETARAAMAELERLGRLAEPALRKAQDKVTDPDATLRIRVLLANLTTEALTTEGLRSLRAVQALEAAGTAEAKAVLAKLADGAESATLTREARAAYDRLQRRRADK